MPHLSITFQFEYGEVDVIRSLSFHLTALRLKPQQKYERYGKARLRVAGSIDVFCTYFGFAMPLSKTIDYVISC